MEPGSNQDRNGAETGAYRGGGSAPEGGDSEFELVSAVVSKSAYEAATGEYSGNGKDVPVKTGVWHESESGLEEGSGLDFEGVTFESSGLLAEEQQVTSQELKITVPNRPERNFTIVDRGLFSDFSELQYVAHGSFGVVLKGMDRLGREVALKVLTSEKAEEAQRFHNESTITAQLGAAEPSDRIIKVYSRGAVDIIDGRGERRQAPYASMEFIDQTLSGKVEKLAELSKSGNRAEYYRELENALRVHLKNACMGIEYAHSRGIIHRDIKPDNIATSTAELGERTRILDWGLGKHLVAAESAGERELPSVTDLMSMYTARGTIVGSPPYMSPEQADSGQVEGAQADVYALGATMYELLTGDFPHKGTSGIEMILGKLKGELSLKRIEESNPLVPRPLRLIVEKAMARDVTERYQSAAEVAEDIERYYSGQQVRASELLPVFERVKEAGQLFLARHKRPLTVATLLVGSIVPSAVWGISTQREAGRARDRAAAVSSMYADVERLPITDADYGIRQIDSMLMKVEGERHEVVLTEVERLRAERERLQEFVEFREAEREKFDRFVREGQNIVGSMVFLYRDLYSEKDATHEQIEKLLALFGADKNPDWSAGLSRDVFTEAQVKSLEEITFNLQIAAVLRVLPIQAGNREHRLSLVDPVVSKSRAERAVPYLERVRNIVGDDTESYTVAWLTAVTNALRQDEPFPETPTHLKPETEIDYFLAAWGVRSVNENAQLALDITREGLEKHPRSGLLYMMESQSLLGLEMPHLSYDAALQAGQYLSSDIKVLQLIKSISLQNITFVTEDPADFLNYSIKTMNVINQTADGIENLDLAFRSEIHFRRLESVSRIVSSAQKKFPANEKIQAMIPSLVQVAKDDLSMLAEIGAQYVDLRMLAKIAPRLANVNEFEAADKILEIFDSLSENYPEGRALIDKAHWIAYCDIYRVAESKKRDDLLSKYAEPRFVILKRVLNDFDADALINFILTENTLRTEETAIATARTFTALVQERAGELNITEGALPVLPDASEVPFSRVNFTSKKGPVVFERHPGGLRWRETVTISNGQKEYYLFTQVKVEGNSVILHDRDRNFWVKLSPEKIDLWREATKQWGLLYINRD